MRNQVVVGLLLAKAELYERVHRGIGLPDRDLDVG